MQLPLPPLLSEQAQMDYIREKKRIEYQYAEPYMKPVANPYLLSEHEIREMVREALMELPQEDRVDMAREKKEAYKEIALEEYDRFSQRSTKDIEKSRLE